MIEYALPVAIFTACISAAVLLVHIVRVRKHYTWEKKSRALSYSLTKNERLRNARTILAKTFKLSSRSEPVSLEEIDSAQEHLHEIETCIIDILGHWENMSLAIEHKIVDEEVASEMVASMVITYAYMFQEFIKRRRKDNKRAYKYLEHVVINWQNLLEDGEKAKEYKIRFDEI